MKQKLLILCFVTSVRASMYSHGSQCQNVMHSHENDFFGKIFNSGMNHLNILQRNSCNYYEIDVQLAYVYHVAHIYIKILSV